jgi:DNA helicase-2/ATP-dependent DNA helicase PcrA
LFGALREYRKGKPLFIRDLVEFADLHERNGIPLADTTPFASAMHAVNLLTAHKAKGLEFDTVFVASCQEEIWAGRGFPNKLPFPINLRSIEQEEGGDDRLRIFYVALTRARKDLYVTAYRQDDSGKPSVKVRFLAPEVPNGPLATHLANEEPDISADELVRGLELLPPHPEFFPIVPGERAILLELVKDYRMSVTHLNNFLNVAEGGPAVFLEQNLLRFPQAMRPAAIYGDAMHRAIEQFYRAWRKNGKVPGVEKLLEWFGEWMGRVRMTEAERLHFLHAGEEALPVWYEKRGKHIPKGLRSEVDFRSQGVVLDGVPLSGKIDKIVPDGKGKIHVTDFKTGKAKPHWEGRNIHERILLHEYKRQLVFYKILVEHSHEFRDFRVERGTLEFIEPVNGDIATLDLLITDNDVERLKALIAAVYARIKALDFPDIEHYSKDLEGILAFEEHLLGS